MTGPDPHTVPPRPDSAPFPIGADPPFDAVIFDMDGVVTDTAAVHAAAWKELFDAVLADPCAKARASVEPFDLDLDYRRYVDGRAREDGVAAFLTARGLSLPAGTPSDPPDAWTVWGLDHHPRPLQPRPAHPVGQGHGPPRQRPRPGAAPPVIAQRGRGAGWRVRAG